MSQSINYNFSNAYERSMTAKNQVDWMIRFQGFDPPIASQVDNLSAPPPAPLYHGGTGGSSMLAEVINSPWRRTASGLLDDQIQYADEISLQKFNTNTSDSSHLQGFHLISSSAVAAPESTTNPSQFTWIPSSGAGGGLNSETARMGRILEGQGLSLSLSSSLKNLEATKMEKLSIGHGELFFHGMSPSSHQYGLSSLATNQQFFHHDQSQVYLGYADSTRVANGLRNSRYLRAAQELLEEFCCVGKGQLMNQKSKKVEKNPNPNSDDGRGTVPNSSSTEQPSLSPSERTEYHRRKIKLLSMLDEVYQFFG